MLFNMRKNKMNDEYIFFQVSLAGSRHFLKFFFLIKRNVHYKLC